MREWEAEEWVENGEAEREKASTCGRHYSVGQDTVALHGAFCQGELLANGCGKDGGSVQALEV